MKKSSIIKAFTAFVLAGTVAFSATKFQQKQFTDGDKDGDKSLSKEEYVAVKMAAAKRASEKNSKEFKAEAVAKRMGNAFAKHDTDGNGKLSADEFFASFPAKKKK
jgi:hypothetical protein